MVVGLRWDRISGSCLLAAALASGGALFAQAESRPEEAPESPVVEIRMLGVNDLHGNLESPYDLGDRPVGGVAYLASYLDLYERGDPEGTIRVHSGDMVGGSPLISGYFHDEPTIYAMNEMGFDAGTLGNHEFDKGGEEMLRLIDGGVRAGGESASDPDFPGADFPYLAANVLWRDSGETVLPPYLVLERRGVKVGIIGVTTLDTPEIAPPEAVSPFRFVDISESVDRYVTELRERGVEAIVVLAESQYRDDRVRVLQVSGLRYSYDLSRPAGSRITGVTLDGGSALDPSARYSVVVEGFLASGGDGFTVFKEGRGAGAAASLSSRTGRRAAHNPERVEKEEMAPVPYRDGTLLPGSLALSKTATLSLEYIRRYSGSSSRFLAKA
jgi:2',3'-cyclic-nucleotide 2'-phosphodiesterase (5'-nucleotidase family)